MKPPKSAETFETPLAICWLDNGLLCVDTKNVERTEENTKEHYKIIKSRIKKKVCWLVDITICVNFQRASRLVIEEELPSACTAIALVAQRPCERLVAHFLLGAKKHGVPAEIFKTQKEARAWLQQQNCRD